MDHLRLYELQLETLNVEIKHLKKENQKLLDELLETRDEVYDWKEKYKELKKTITG